ncbi:MAG: BatD family protein [Polyangiales bacterium]
MTRFSFAAAVVVCASLGAALRAGEADAASKMETASGVDRPVVGLGETLVYTIAVSSTSGSLQIASPVPGKIDGFDLLGQRNAPGIDGGRAVIRIHYTLRAKKLGTFLLGPGRVTTSEGDISTPLVKVQVVAAGTAPAPPKPPPKPKKKGFFPDPFDEMFPEDEFFKPPPPPPPEPVAPPDPLARVDALPTAPSERHTFVRFAVDDPHPVVGAPIVGKLFVYSQMGAPGVEVRKVPTVPDFRIAQLNTKGEKWKPILIEGQQWNHGLASAWTLYPLRAGKLEIKGAEAVTTLEDPFTGKVVSEEAHAAQPVTVEAVEPPLEGRPAGYVLGDVASELTVSADVSPRQVKDGHAVVQVKMKGIGRIDPLRPILATPPGVTWTSTDDDVRTVLHDLSIEGQRRLTFDARFDRNGDVDLGDVVVNVWDPAKKAYFSARANLGHVQVEKVAEKDDKGGTELPPLPPAREAIGRIGGGDAIVDSTITWAIVGGAPILVVAVQLLGAASRKRRIEREGREASPAEQARAAIEAARRGEDVLGSLTRALDRAVEARTGVRARGLTRSDLSAALGSESKKERILRAFGDLESARFAGGSAPSVDEIARLVEELLPS